MFVVIRNDYNDGVDFFRYKTLEEAKHRIEAAPYDEDREYWLAELIGEYVPVQTVEWELVEPTEEEEDTEEEEE